MRKNETISSLIPDSRNANRGNPRGTALLEDSLRKHGAGRSILLDKNNRVIAGNKTLEGAASIGLEDVQIVESDGKRLIAVKRTDIDLDTAEGRELALADNRVGEVNLDWDADVLAAFQDEGVDLSALWHEDELKDLLAECGNGGGGSSGGETPADENDSTLGYAIYRDGVNGKALLDARKNNGMELVKRLKDAEQSGEIEAAFWASQMAAMAKSAGRLFDGVSFPPSSGKRDHSLARVLAEDVASLLGIPCRDMFSNPKPRGGKAPLAVKLTEENHYKYEGRGEGDSILLVDDAYCTGRTLLRCVEAMGADRPWLCVLCRS